MVLLCWLLMSLALAETFPFSLPDSQATSDWQEALEATGFVRANPASGPGASLTIQGDDAILTIRDLDGVLHRIQLQAPSDANGREALLVLAANLIRPARFSAPPPLPPAPPPPLRRPQAPQLPEPLQPSAGLTAWPQPLLPESFLRAGLQLLTPQPSPMVLGEDPGLRHRLRAEAAVVVRDNVPAGQALGLIHRSGGALWLGSGVFFTNEAPDPTGLIASSLLDTSAELGSGWQATGRLQPEVGLWLRGTYRSVSGSCYMCGLSGDALQESEALLASGEASAAQFWSDSTERLWLPSLRVAALLHWPVGRSGWEVVPFATLERELQATRVPGYYQSSPLSPIRGTTGIALEKVIYRVE